MDEREVWLLGWRKKVVGGRKAVEFSTIKAYHCRFQTATMAANFGTNSDEVSLQFVLNR